MKLIGFISFHEFFGLDFLKFSGPLWEILITYHLHIICNVVVQFMTLAWELRNCWRFGNFVLQNLSTHLNFLGLKKIDYRKNKPSVNLSSWIWGLFFHFVRQGAASLGFFYINFATLLSKAFMKSCFSTSRAFSDDFSSSAMVSFNFSSILATIFPSGMVSLISSWILIKAKLALFARSSSWRKYHEKILTF